MNMKEKKISREHLYKGKIINVYRDLVFLPNQKQTYREVVEHPGASAILPICGDEVLLVSQYRYPYGQELLEIPAGKIDINELPRNTAIRELKEEIGALCYNLYALGKIYPSPGYSNEIIYLYYTTSFSIANPSLDEDEFINVRKIKIDKVLDMINEDKIIDAKTIIALYKYIYLQRGVE